MKEYDGARSQLGKTIQPAGILRESLAELVVDRIPAWRCATCGWTEAARDCLGICVRDRVDFVPPRSMTM